MADQQNEEIYQYEHDNKLLAVMFKLELTNINDDLSLSDLEKEIHRNEIYNYYQNIDLTGDISDLEINLDTELIDSTIALTKCSRKIAIISLVRNNNSKNKAIETIKQAEHYIDHQNFCRASSLYKSYS